MNIFEQSSYEPHFLTLGDAFIIALLFFSVFHYKPNSNKCVYMIKYFIGTSKRKHFLSISWNKYAFEKTGLWSCWQGMEGTSVKVTSYCNQRSCMSDEYYCFLGVTTRPVWVRFLLYITNGWDWGWVRVGFKTQVFNVCLDLLVSLLSTLL